MGEFRMPALGADMDYGTLVEWKVKPGDRVKRGDIVAVVETVKGAIDIEVFEAGVIGQLLAKPGDQLAVGAPLAVIDAEAAPAARPAPAPGPAPRAVGRQRVSPVARKLAAERGVDLAQLKGTGPGGAITRADVEGAAGPATPAARGMRDVIAAAMTRSKREIPHYYLSTHVDLGRALDWMQTRNQGRPVNERLVPAALLLKATALAIRAAPELNGTWKDGEFHPSEPVHLGVAISLRQGGLVAPAIHGAAKLPLDELMARLLDLVSRARSGGLRSSELSDPTLTVTNLGDLGVDLVLGVIYPPQVAIVGFGRIARRPWVVAGRIEERPVLTASLSADHRVSDGHRGGQLLSAIERLLQEPERL